MENRIDQLFKEKLGEHKIAPSAEAWAKVQSGLTKKNKVVIVWRMAAALVLFGAGVGAWYLLNIGDARRLNQLSQTNEVIKPEKEVSEKTTESITQSMKSTSDQNAKTVIKGNKTASRNRVEKVDNTTETVVIKNNELEKLMEGNLITTEPILITQTAKTEKPIVIEFTLEAVTKAPMEEVVQVVVEENSGLKKILEAARDVKNGDSDLGIIRDTKNQLFALDFRKEKTKRN